MIENIRIFNRETSLERFISHSGNSNITLEEASEKETNTPNTWSCGILWGNEDIKGLIIVRFTTLNILAMASNAFESANDSQLFEYTKDFMKEYCNFFAGFIKGTYNNENIDISLSLPIFSKTLSKQICDLGSNFSLDEDTWIIKSGGSSFIIESYVSTHKDLDHESLKFLSKNKDNSGSGDIEFF